MALLQINGLVKNFGGLTALNKISLKVEPRMIHGLIGPNGSGKTTLFNVVSGIFPSDKGEVIFGDRHIGGKPPHAIAQLGLARTFQEIELFYDMTVLENVIIGCYRLTRAGVFGALVPLPWVRDEERMTIEKARECLQFVGLQDYEEERARNISYGHQRLLEIARALASDPQLLLLDEPAAGMNPNESKELIELIARIRDRGVTVLLVEHNMKLVMSCCEHITVLNYGEVICDGTPGQVQCNEGVIEAYLGKVRERGR
jgi:branched-chain amino acid transport system ATP-binding protein